MLRNLGVGRLLDLGNVFEGHSFKLLAFLSDGGVGSVLDFLLDLGVLFEFNFLLFQLLGFLLLSLSSGCLSLSLGLSSG